MGLAGEIVSFGRDDTTVREVVDQKQTPGGSDEAVSYSTLA